MLARTLHSFTNFSPPQLTSHPPPPCLPNRRLLISIPLSYSGGILAAKQEVRQYPTRTNQVGSRAGTAHGLESCGKFPVQFLLALLP